MKLLTKIFIIIDIIAIFCFTLFYGPFKGFRTYLISTAIETYNHKYIAYTFYSNKMIDDVLKENYMEVLEENTDVSKITIGDISDNYDSIYEEEILKHEEDEDYKLIKFKYNGFSCYLVAIYDPTRVHAVAIDNLNKGKILTDIAKDNDAVVAINGGGYTWSTYMPKGFVLTSGNLRYSASSTKSYVTGAFNKDGVLMVGSYTKKTLLESGATDALTFGPVLIANGKSVKIVGHGGSGKNPRTVLAQRKDGIVLFLVVNGYDETWRGRGGVYLDDLLVILERYGAYNAINMDGGSSTTMVINGELINNPCEPVKNGQDYIKSAWIFK